MGTRETHTRSRSGETHPMARPKRPGGKRKRLQVFIDPVVLRWLEHEASDVGMSTAMYAGRILELNVLMSKGRVLLADLGPPLRDLRPPDSATTD